MQLPDIKFDPFYICLFTSNPKLELAYTSLSLAFDFCAFITVVVSVYRAMPASLAKDLMFTGVIGAVVQGATVYFALVFTSQLTLTMFVLFGRVCRIEISFGISDRFFRILCFFLMIIEQSEVGDRTVS